MKWWLKIFCIGGVFGFGVWFGHNFTTMHYEKVLSQERSTHARVCLRQVEGALAEINIKFCSQWNVSVPPYDESLAEIVAEIEAEEKRKRG